MVKIEEFVEQVEQISPTDKYNELLSNMQTTKEKWDKEGADGLPQDDQDLLLSQAIGMAIEQGRGWSPGEKEAYLEKILDDDFIPPMFAGSPEEVEKSGLREAFTSLIYDDETPTSLMLQFKKKAAESFRKGKMNQVKNMEYYRAAINQYYEAFAWAQKIEPMQAGDFAQVDTDDPTFTPDELNVELSNICANIALMHMQLRNWGLVRQECKKSLEFNDKNVKSWYRIAKAYQGLQDWEAAGDAIDSGLAIEPENKDLKKLQGVLLKRVKTARKQRQQRERARAERTSKVKQVWKHCKEAGIQLGRGPLVNSVTDDEEDDDEKEESRWHQHMPHSGKLPCIVDLEWAWPCMFVYPSHQTSDFIEHFQESEMFAIRMALMFPELETDEETAMPWDYKNEFTCGQLAVYFEVWDVRDHLVHPESVELLRDQASCMRFYEATRALKGDEGPDMANVVRAVERKHLYQQRKAWKAAHGSLWAKPDPNPVVRVHPAATLKDVLLDGRLVISNFIVTFIVFPENHPAHEEYLKEHKCVGIINPTEG
jgi:tetratricopeptide (TPR) repeat protein